MAANKRRTSSKPSGTRRPAGSSGYSGNPARRAAPKPSTLSTTDESAFRRWLADHSKGLVVRLSRLPNLAIPVAIVVLMFVGLVAPVVPAVIALAVIVLFMGWLAFLSWPVLNPRQRGVRLLAIAIITFVAVARIAGWL